MKGLHIAGYAFLLVFLAVGITAGCSNDDEELNDPSALISQAEKNALLFMLEEEKMARDVYRFLDEKWDRPEFENIARSEESHMAAIENQLNRYEISFTIMPSGEFENDDLQQLYEYLTELGETSLVAALTVGATIEDLDIADLEEYITALDNTAIINVFSSLQCGSRNHLRAFTGTLENLGVVYTPQFIPESTYLDIINSDNENCNP